MRLSAAARADLDAALASRLDQLGIDPAGIDATGEAGTARGPTARRAAAYVRRWRAAVDDLVARAEADHPCAALRPDVPAPISRRLRRVWVGLSDPHGHGRSVCVVQFAGGRGGTVVYKPRSLRVDAAVAAFLGWLADAAPDLPRLRGVRTLDRGAYGWAEYVESAPCADRGALTRYYERAGALLAAAYVLRIGDLHSENVVAAGEYPMLIDLEAALTPVYRRHTAVRRRGDPERGSVLETGLLPVVCVNANGTGYAEGGIALVPGQWGAARAHVPTCDAAAGPPALDGDAVRAAVCAGFDRAYRALQAHQEALLARDGPLRAFAGGRVRVVIRATAVYAALLRRLAQAPFVHDAARRAAELDRLYRPFQGQPEWDRMAPVFAAEAAALTRGDVPRFEVTTGGTALRADGRVVMPDFAALCGLAAVRRRVRALDDVDRRRQLAYVRVALAAEAHRLASPPPTANGVGPTPAAHTDWSDLDWAGEATAEARRLGSLLAHLADRGEDFDPPTGATIGPLRRRDVRWYVLDRASGATTLLPVDASLGHGAAGIALVFAALATAASPSNGNAGGPTSRDIRDISAWASLARAAFTSVGRSVARRRGLGRLGALGLAAGAGGVAYAACAAARWLGDDTLLDVARAALAAAADPRYAHRPARDVFGGVAGWIFGALAYHEVTGTPGVLAQAVAAGDRLLTEGAWADGAPDHGADDRAARRHGIADAREGFGFGGPGRAVALLRLAARAGTARHAVAATALLDAAACRLAPRLTRRAPGDARTGAEHLGGWCDGTVGVGMALAAALASGAGAADARSRWRDVLAQTAAAVATGAHAAPARSEHYPLCCGTFARVELLLEAAAVLDAPAYAAAARRLAAAAVARAHRRLAYHPVPHGDPYVPGLFTGLAGAAYTLLRVVDPGRVPSVLAGVLPPAARR